MNLFKSIYNFFYTFFNAFKPKKEKIYDDYYDDEIEINGYDFYILNENLLQQ